MFEKGASPLRRAVNVACGCLLMLVSLGMCAFLVVGLMAQR